MTWRFVFGEHIINSQAEISDNPVKPKLLFVNKNGDLCQSWPNKSQCQSGYVQTFWIKAVNWKFW
jgi:hypothetical protein